MAKSYEIATLRDVLDKVPSDRIQMCLNELGLLLASMKALTEQAEVPSEKLHTENVWTWVDDGKQDVGFELRTMDDKPRARVTLSPEPDVEVFDSEGDNG